MTEADLDALMTRPAAQWRPSMAFLAALGERLDAVDAELEAEAARVPREGARGDDSVLFRVEALERARVAAADHPRAEREPSGVLDLARLRPPPPPAPLDSGPLPVGRATPLARGRRPQPLWLAAAAIAVATAAAALAPAGAPDAAPSPALTYADAAPAAAPVAPGTIAAPARAPAPGVASIEARGAAPGRACPVLGAAGRPSTPHASLLRLACRGLALRP